MGTQDTENHVGANTIEHLKARGFDPGLTAEHRKKTALPASPADAFNVWKAEPVACADLMNPSFTVMGAGLWGKYEGGTAAYWTQILTTPKGNAQPSLTFTPPTATVTVGGAAIPFTANLTDSAEAITFSLTGPGSFTSVGATATYAPPTTGGAGTATLKATAGALTASATITITAQTNPPGLTVTPTTAMVAVGAGPIQFKSSTNQVAWEMTGVGTFAWQGDTFTYSPPATGTGGTATITVRSGELTATVTVVTLSVAPATATVAVGGAAIPFSATLTSSADPITWSLTGLGSLSSTAGTTTSYTPPTTGGADTATLTATVGTVTASATVTINAANPDALQVDVKDLQRQALVPPFAIHSLGRHLSDLPVAPWRLTPTVGPTSSGYGRRTTKPSSPG